MNGSDRMNDESGEMVVLVRRRLALYEEETSQLLRRAYEWAKTRDEEQQRLYQRDIGDNRVPVFPKQAPVQTSSIAVDDEAKHVVSEMSSDDDNDFGLATIESEDESDGSNNDSESEEDNGGTNGNEISPSPTGSPTAETPPEKTTTAKPAKTPKLSGREQKRLAQDITRHADNLIRIDFPLPPSESECECDGNEVTETEKAKNSHLHLFPAAALLRNEQLREPINVRDQACTVKDLSERLSSTSADNAVVVVLLIQSGRFGGGVFRRGKCLAHRATTRYTIRKGQGKAQSTQDGSRRPKSIGSQLRRAGEEQLNEDVKTTLMEWTEKGYIDNACLIFLACPRTMRSTVFAPTDANSSKTKGNKNKNKNTDFMLSKDDGRVRKVPFDVGRATFHNVEVVYNVLMAVDLCHVQSDPQKRKENKAIESVDCAVTSDTTEKDEEHDAEEEKRKRKEKLNSNLPMTPLHVAARDGNLTVLLDLVNKINHSADDSADDLDVDQPAGYDCMTPLHFAASASKKVNPVTASALVSALLVQARADPTVLDASGRPPYFLAGHDKIREAFRKARAILGEEYCDWNDRAKVGPPLTESDLEAKKEREAEKKRRKKARQKEKKEKDKAAALEAEKQRKAEEEAKQAAEEAKRVRDGLSAKPTGANVCDFCHKVCKGRNASKNMFRRLDYKYCSTECVNKHKRELMAAAAMARFG